MKRSRSRNVAVLAVAFATLTSCSAFRAKPEVEVQAVPVSLIFGAKVKKAEPAAPLPDFPTTPPPFEVPPPPPPPPKTDPCEENPYQRGCAGFQLCPPPSAPSARDASPNDIRVGENEPRPVEGKYLFAHYGNHSGEPEQLYITENDLTGIGPVADEGYYFSFFNRVNNVHMRFEVHPSPGIDEEADPQADAPGLFLKQIDIPPKSATDDRAYVFGPTDPIRMMTFPINAGEIVEDASPEFSPKRGTGVPDADGNEILQPSSNTLRSHVEVGAPEIVEVCADLAQAYKITWTLTITGDFQATMTGTFWISTAYGGWPIKESYVIANAGELIEGNFSASLMRLDPTGFI